MPPLPRSLLGSGSHVFGEYALNATASSYETELSIDELSVLRVHLSPVDVDVDASVVDALGSTLTTSARGGVGHEETLLLPLAKSAGYALRLRFRGAQRSGCPASRYAVASEQCAAAAW